MNHENSNGHKNGRSAKAPWTQDLKKADAQRHAIEMFLAGASIAAIAKELQCSIRQVQRYISETRAQVLAKKKDYFDEHLSGLLEQNLEALQEMAGLFSDAEFLRTAAPERIHALSVANGILSDKTFIILAAASRHQERGALLGPGDPGDGERCGESAQ